MVAAIQQFKAPSVLDPMVKRSAVGANVAAQQLSEAKLTSQLASDEDVAASKTDKAAQAGFKFMANILQNVKSPESFEAARNVIAVKSPEGAEAFDSLFPQGYDQGQVGVLNQQLRFMVQQPKTKVLGVDQQLVTEGGTVVAEGKDKEEKAVSTVGKLISDAEEGGQQFTPEQKAKIYTDAITKANALKKGDRISLDAEGNLLIESGGESGITQAPGMGRPATNVIQKALINATEGIKRLAQIENGIKDEFLTYQGKFKSAFLNVKEKFGSDLSPEEKKYQEEFSAFAQNSIENINLYIKEITGAQMSEAEAKRLRKAVADIGDGIIAGDGPTKFRSKLANQMKKLRMSAARLHYVNNNGLTINRNNRGEVVMMFDKEGNPLEIESMPRIINDRAKEIGAELKAAGIKAGLINDAVMKRVRTEFGLLE